MTNWATLGVPPPTKPVDRAESARFVRAMLVRTLVIVCPVWIVLWVVSGVPGWMLIVATGSVAVLIVDIAWLTSRIRRGDRRFTRRSAAGLSDGGDQTGSDSS